MFYENNYSIPEKGNLRKRRQQTSLIRSQSGEIDIFLQPTRMKSTSGKRKVPTEPIFKIILIGDPATGKSALMRRYVKDEFSDCYQNTIGTQFITKKVKIDANTEVNMQIWDTAGQQTFRSIIKAFFRNSQAILLIYNITDAKSLSALGDWKKLAQQCVPITSLFVLIGTHLDKQQMREVSREQAQKWMKDNQVDFFFETSAKTSENVKKVFQQIAKRIFLNWFSQRKVVQTESEAESVRMKLQKQKLPSQEPQSKCC